MPPISIIVLAWHIGDVPPPHSSVKTTFLPSLLNTAVCQSEKLVSACGVEPHRLLRIRDVHQEAVAARTRRRAGASPDTP